MDETWEAVAPASRACLAAAGDAAGALGAIAFDATSSLYVAVEGPGFDARRHIVPDWLGNRSPLGDGGVRALMTGIGPDDGMRSLLELYYATARALALQSRQVIDHLNAHGFAIDRVSLIGGHLKNPLLVRLYHDAMGPDHHVQPADPAWARAHDGAYRIYRKLFDLRGEIEAENLAQIAAVPPG